MLNKIMLIGRLWKDPEMRFTPQGSAVTTISLVTSRSWRDANGAQQHQETFHTILAWNKLAEVCQQYLAKGRLVYIEGRLQTRSWEDDQKTKHYRTEVIAEQVKFLESGGGQAPPAAIEEEDLPEM